MVPPKEPSGGFVMLVVVVVVFISWEGFHLLLFNVIPHPSMSYRQVYPHGYLPISYIQPSSLQNNFDIFTLTFLGFSLYRESYGFELPFFTHVCFFTLQSFLTYWRICGLDVSRSIPYRIFIYACSHGVISSG